MPIRITTRSMPPGFTDLVAVAVIDFADSTQTSDVIEVACETLGKIKGAKQQWRREEDCCYEIPSSLLSKRGGADKAIAKLRKEIAYLDSGYEKCLELP